MGHHGQVQQTEQRGWQKLSARHRQSTLTQWHPQEDKCIIISQNSSGGKERKEDAVRQFNTRKLEVIRSWAQASLGLSAIWVIGQGRREGKPIQRRPHLVLVMAILTYSALLPWKEYSKYESPTLHCTGYQSIVQRPSPSWARSKEPDRHSGHSSVAMAYWTAVEIGLAPDPDASSQQGLILAAVIINCTIAFHV
jgi:hypothetical protein